MGRASILQVLFRSQHALLKAGRKPTRVYLGRDAYSALMEELYSPDARNTLQEFRETCCVQGVQVVLDQFCGGSATGRTSIEFEVEK